MEGYQMSFCPSSPSEKSQRHTALQEIHLDIRWHVRKTPEIETAFGGLISLLQSIPGLLSIPHSIFQQLASRGWGISNILFTFSASNSGERPGRPITWRLSEGTNTTTYLALS